MRGRNGGPRRLGEAYRWSLKDAAARINAHSGEVGLDPGGIAAMTAAHLCEHENRPGHGPEPSGRRPTPYLLALLAAVYGCAVTDLIDLDDREHLPQPTYSSSTNTPRTHLSPSTTPLRRRRRCQGSDHMRLPCPRTVGIGYIGGCPTGVLVKDTPPSA